MIGHLGSRVSALLDGQMSAEESERAWAHVHQCHVCRDLVEREGWVKTRLAGLSMTDAGAPSDLKGALLGSLAGSLTSPGLVGSAVPPGEYLAYAQPARGRRAAGLVAIGGGAVGAAVMGMLALGTAPADAPAPDRRAPVTSINQGSPSPAPTVAPGRQLQRLPR